MWRPTGRPACRRPAERSGRPVPSGEWCGSAGWAPVGDAAAAAAVAVRVEPRSTGNRTAPGWPQPPEQRACRRVGRPVRPRVRATCRYSAGTTPAGVHARSTVSRTGSTPESPDQPSEQACRTGSGWSARIGECVRNPDLAPRTVGPIIVAPSADELPESPQQWARYPQFPQVYPQHAQMSGIDSARCAGSRHTHCG